jgi:HK97 family phage portal protein
MSLWRRLLGREGKMSSLELFREIYGGRHSSSGPVVNVKTALEVATVLACCRVVAEGVSQVPFKLYRRTPQGAELATDHPLFNLLYRRPNAWQTSFEFRETLVFHLMLTFNAFVFVNRVGIKREIKELIPIEPNRVAVEQLDDQRLQYKVTAKNGEQRTFGAESIWHLRGPSWNSWMGMDAVGLARNAIGLSISLEQGQAEFQKNGARGNGMVSVDGTLTEAQFIRLAAWLDKHAIGGERSGKPFIADGSAKWTPFTMSGVDQQLLETRNHQIEEICRTARVMPIMVGYSDKAATYASAEQMFLAHVTHTLMPWYERIEQSADINLLSERDLDDGYYTKLLPNALLRGAAKDRGEFYAKALGAGGTKGWMTQNDVRELEELNRSADPEADKLPQPAAKTPARPTAPPNED